MSEEEVVLRIAGNGEGVTESGRRVALGAPGDRLQADGSLVPGPLRATPPCRHFPACGGCQLQHLGDDAYAEFLAGKVLGALATQGLAPAELRVAHISPPKSRRRAALSAARNGNQLLLGFNAEASHRIVDMRECHILRPELFALVGPLRVLLTLLMPRKGAATARMTLSDQGPDVLLEKVRGEGLEAAEALTAFAEKHRIARLALDDGFGPQTRWEPEPVTITLGSVPVPLPINAFLQATAEGEAELVRAVREAIGGATVVADLFAGLGTFALSLKGRVYAAEGGRDAALALKAASNRVQLPVAVELRDLFRNPLDDKELGRFEAVVLDPPRAGAKEQAALLARSSIARIAYVSCNPATFARDARFLVDGGYILDWVQPVGQFRWSTHVELVAAFRRTS